MIKCNLTSAEPNQFYIVHGSWMACEGAPRIAKQLTAKKTLSSMKDLLVLCQMRLPTSRLDLTSKTKLHEGVSTYDCHRTCTYPAWNKMDKTMDGTRATPTWANSANPIRPPLVLPWGLEKATMRRNPYRICFFGNQSNARLTLIDTLPCVREKSHVNIPLDLKSKSFCSCSPDIVELLNDTRLNHVSV